MYFMSLFLVHVQMNNTTTHTPLSNNQKKKATSSEIQKESKNVIYEKQHPITSIYGEIKNCDSTSDKEYHLPLKKRKRKFEELFFNETTSTTANKGESMNLDVNFQINESLNAVTPKNHQISKVLNNEEASTKTELEIEQKIYFNTVNFSIVCFNKIFSLFGINTEEQIEIQRGADLISMLNLHKTLLEKIVHLKTISTSRFKMNENGENIMNQLSTSISSSVLFYKLNMNKTLTNESLSFTSLVQPLKELRYKDKFIMFCSVLQNIDILPSKFKESFLISIYMLSSTDEDCFKPLNKERKHQFIEKMIIIAKIFETQQYKYNRPFIINITNTIEKCVVNLLSKGFNVKSKSLSSSKSSSRRAVNKVESVLDYRFIIDGIIKDKLVFFSLVDFNKIDNLLDQFYMEINDLLCVIIPRLNK